MPAALAYPTLVHVLQERAIQIPNDIAFIFLTDGESEKTSLTYGQLAQQAETIAATLQELAAKDERVLLMYPPGLDYIAAFFGCLYVGATAVPAYPPPL